MTRFRKRTMYNTMLDSHHSLCGDTRYACTPHPGLRAPRATAGKPPSLVAAAYLAGLTAPLVGSDAVTVAGPVAVTSPLRARAVRASTSSGRPELVEGRGKAGPGAIDIVGGLKVERLIATGHSQSAGRLYTYATRSCGIISGMRSAASGCPNTPCQRQPIQARMAAGCSAVCWVRTSRSTPRVSPACIPRMTRTSRRRRTSPRKI